MLDQTHNTPVVDQFSRPLQELRVSVTDRCNFRCVYCMPKETFTQNYQYLDRKEILSFEEIERLVRLLVDLGVRKVRLTGGEPLIRRDLEHLVEMLAGIEDLQQLTLTTNGALLTAQRARDLKSAGLQRINISLDAIDNPVFQRCNDVGFPVERVLEAIENAAAAGLAPVKINMVVQKDLNEDQILPMVRHFRGTGHILRFIEFMDVGTMNGWQPDEVITAREIVATIAQEFPLVPVTPRTGSEVSKSWRYADGKGEMGIIASVSEPFCGGCNRARISAEGVFYTCLFANGGTDLRPLIRSQLSDDQLTRSLVDIWNGRRDRYSELRALGIQEHRIEMSYIGG